MTETCSFGRCTYVNEAHFLAHFIYTAGLKHYEIDTFRTARKLTLTNDIQYGATCEVVTVAGPQEEGAVKDNVAIWRCRL
jgi:hypothetical protein